MHQLVRLVLWTALILVPVASLSAEPRCALIDVDQTALGGLLEAELLALPNTQWVERTEIQKLRDEQRLQSLYSAQSGDARRSVGSLLKADVLIILRVTEEDRKKYAELVVAEMNQGIRLVRQKLLLGKDPANDAELLGQLASDGITKSKTSIRHIFAVPPLVNNDLTYEYDYLKSTYAKLLERTLLDSPSVVVVELDEAKAITNEYVAAGSGDEVARKLPVYVLGEYLNQGRGEDRRVKLSLKTQQGSKVLSEKEETLKPDSVPDVLLKYAEQLASSQGIAVSPIAPQQEVKVLNERANLFVRLANWDEAQALVEASLLLVPDQPEMHSQAVTIIQRRLEDYQLDYLDEFQRDIQLKRQAMAHMKVLIEKSRFDLARQHWLLFQQNIIPDHRYYVKHDEAIEKLAQDGRSFQKLNQEMAMLMVHGLAEMQDWRLSSYLLHRAIMDLPPDQRYGKIKNVILKFQHKTDSEYFTRRYILADEQPRVIRSLEGRAFLQDLIDTPEVLPHVRQAAEALLREIRIKPATKISNRSNADSVENHNLTFRRLDFDQFTTVRGVSKLGDHWDLIDAEDGYFLYNKDGEVRRIGKQGHNATSQFDYDGRYIWVVYNDSGDKVTLEVVDPETWKRYELTKEDGLPILDRNEVPDVTVDRVSLGVTPLGPGHAMLHGYVGRAWFADVKFDPRGNHQVNIFYEAKQTLPADKNGVNPDNLDMRFRPSNIWHLQRKENDKVVEQGVIVHRFSMSRPLSSVPLWINPEDWSVRVADAQWGRLPNGWIVDGKVFAERAISLKDKRLGIYARGLTDKETKLVVSDYDEGKFFHDTKTNMLHIVGQEWCLADLETGEVTSLGPVPWYYRHHWSFNDSKSPSRLEDGTYVLGQLSLTNHFGLVLNCHPHAGGKELWLQVFFDGSGEPFKRVASIDQGRDESSDAGADFRKQPITQQVNLWNSPQRIEDVAYFPNGKKIVTISKSSNGALCVWDAESGEIATKMLCRQGTLTCLAVSPSGEYLATGGSDGSVVLWSAQDIQPLRKWTDLREKVVGLAFSADSSQLAATNGEMAACVWNVDKGEKQYDFIGNSSAFGFSKLLFTQDDQLLLAIQAQIGVRAYDAKQGTDLGKIETFEWVAGDLPDGSLLGVGKGSANDLVRRQPDGTTKVVWPRFSGGPVAISNNGRFIATFYSGSYKDRKRDPFFHRIEIWDAQDKSMVFAEEGMREPVVAFSPDGTTLVLKTSSGVAKKVSLIATDKADVSPAGGMPRPAAADGLLTPMRTWTDTSGRFQIKAALVKQDGSAVVLKSDKGDRLTVPISILSHADRQFLKELAEQN